MDLDALLRHYFGTADVASLSAESYERGQEALAIDFGTERDPGRRFALWALMHMLGTAPDPEAAFESQSDRDAARRFASLMGRIDRPLD